MLATTEADLDAETIPQLYASRWGVKLLFHNLKRWRGTNNVWQKTRTALELRMQIRSCAWTLTHLLSLAIAGAFPMEQIAPWRLGQPVIAGLVAQWPRREFPGLTDFLRERGMSGKLRCAPAYSVSGGTG